MAKLNGAPWIILKCEDTGQKMRDMGDENACLYGSFDISLIAKEAKV